MKRKLLSFLIVMTMGMSLLVGCRGGENTGDKYDATVNQQSDNTFTDEDSETDNISTQESAESDMESQEVPKFQGEEVTWDAFFEVNSIGGTNVKVYYDPNVIASASTLWEPEFTVTDIEGNVYKFAIGDFDTAEDFFKRRIDEFNSIQSKTNEEFSELEEYRIVGENTVKKYNLEYDQISTDNNNAVYTPVSYSECIIELGSVVVCFDNTEGQKFWDVLAAMKFVADNDTSGNGGTNTSQDEDKDVDSGNSENTEVVLQTCEFPACVKGQTGILTYNGDFVEVSNSDKINGADFDVKVTDGNRTHTIGVTLGVHSDMSAEEEVQSDKEWMETKAKTFQISEIRETTINEIPVQYYSCVYSMNGENENKFFNCFIEFPTIKEYYNYTITLRVDRNKEDELILSALENLLVDVELLGVKPLGVGEVIIENDTVDENKYYPEYLKTPDGKIVTVYMDMDAEITWEVDREVPSSIYIYDKNHEMCYFSVGDAVSAEEYANNILQWNDYLEIGTQEEIQLAGRTIHTYHFVDKETGEVFISEGVIELASDVVFTFTYGHMSYDEAGLEEVLEALRFIVE